MGINRIRLANGSPLEMAKAQQTAASDPALDAIRQKLFGQNYIQDIGRGQGIAQYYSNFGTPSSLQFTQPAVSTPAVDTSTPVVDTGGGGGGQATLPSFDVDAPKNTAADQRLIDAGIGLQVGPGQPVVAPGEMPVTQAEMDAFNQIPVNREFGAPMDIGFGEGQVDPKLAAAVGGKDTTPVTGGNLVTTASGDVFAADSPMLQEKMDFMPEQQGTIQNILGQAGQTVEGALTQLGKIPGAVVDAANQTVDVFGKKLNVGKTLAGLAVNKLVGGPATLVFDLLKDVIPERDPRQNELDRFYDVENNKIQSGLMAGYNPVSGGGLYTLTGGRAGEEPTYGLQEAYDKRINTIENTLATKYPDGDYSDTQLDERLAELKDLKAREKDVLDAAETGAPQENIGAIDSIYSAPDTIVGPNIDEEAGRFGAPITTDITSDQINEFGTAPVTGVTRPETVLGKPGIERFDDAEASIDMFDDLPSGASKTGTPVDALNPINRQQHFDNTEKLKDAVRSGDLTNEEYNVLSAFDARKTMGLGPVTGTLSAAAYQGAQTGAGILRETLGLNPAFAGDQSIAEATGDTARNIQGVSGNVSPELQVRYQEIISGEDIYRDPILGMVEPPAPMTLADDFGDAFDYFDDVDISQDAPVGTFDADIFDDFDDGTMTGSAADSMDDVLGPMPSIPTPRVPDFISGGREDKPTGPPSTGFKAPTKQGQSPRGSTTGGGGGRDSCFLPDTLVTMADGSTKKIIDVDIGDEVAEGGKVFATGKFLNNELYDYKGIKVSGSHMVNEDGVWMRIRDTKHGKPLGDDEHTVYVFGSENRRILINNILFTDYFEIKEQEKLIDNEKDFFNNWKTYGNKIDQDNINILNAS